MSTKGVDYHSPPFSLVLKTPIIFGFVFVDRCKSSHSVDTKLPPVALFVQIWRHSDVWMASASWKLDLADFHWTFWAKNYKNMQIFEDCFAYYEMKLQ